MIRVSVCIEPGGDATRSREIAEIEVWNDRGDIDEADYKWAARLEGAKYLKGEVRSHRRSLGWTPLITRVIFDMQQRLQHGEHTSPDDMCSANAKATEK